MTRISVGRAPAAAGATAAGRRRCGFARAWMCALAVVLAPAQATTVVAINGPWVRVAPSGTSAEAFMEIQSAAPAALIDVRSDAAGKITLLSAGKRNVPIAEMPLPAGTLVALAPGGLRVRLERLVRPLKLGDYVPLTVTIRGNDGKLLTMPLNAEVRKRSARDEHRQAPGH